MDDPTEKYYQALIDAENDGEKLFEAKLVYSKKCIPDLNFWRSWFSGEEFSTEGDFQAKIDIFNEALSMCPTEELALMYLDFLSKCVEDDLLKEEEYRTGFEKAVSACGMDIMTGGKVWKKLQEFELEEYQDLLEVQSNPDTLRRAKARLINVYTRQLSLPSIHGDDALRAFEQVMEEVCTEADLSLVQPSSLDKKVLKAREEREARMVFETHLSSNKYTNSSTLDEKINSWQAYIKFEMSAGHLSRAQRLFERCLLDPACKRVLSLWLQYSEWCLTTIKNFPLLGLIARRAVRLFPANTSLWRTRIMAFERGDTGDAEGPEDLYNEVLVATYSAGFVEAGDYLEMLLMGCDLQAWSLYDTSNRSSSRTGSSSSSSSGDGDDSTGGLGHPTADAMRQAFAAAESFLESYYPQWMEGTQ